ncbi:MAG: hypothetical protein MUC60_05570 [Oscillatoria sp. Prado101]|nr:hypothetical protein [Oscillatoria sp. Prado101]
MCQGRFQAADNWPIRGEAPEPTTVFPAQCFFRTAGRLSRAAAACMATPEPVPSAKIKVKHALDWELHRWYRGSGSIRDSRRYSYGVISIAWGSEQNYLCR